MGQAADAFELAVAVEPADIDQLGHVNNITYLRWVQEAAVAHWTAAAPPADQAKLLWVVVRHEIDYKQAAFLGDGIVARTWVGSASRIRFERFTELLRARDRAVLAKARTLWCPIDSRTGRPANVSPEVRACFSVEAAPDGAGRNSLHSCGSVP
jgi:acyl-CoA thioester hydrolase